MIIESDTSSLIATELFTSIHRLQARSTWVRAPLLPACLCLHFAAPANAAPAHTCTSSPRDSPVRALACARSLKVSEHLMMKGRALCPAKAASSSAAVVASTCS